MKTQNRQVQVILGFLFEREDIDVVERKIAEAKQRAEKEGITNVRLDIDYEKGYYSNVTITAHIIGYRPETPEETKLREQHDAETQRRNEKAERENYLRLKKKYEGK